MGFGNGIIVGVVIAFILANGWGDEVGVGLAQIIGAVAYVIGYLVTTLPRQVLAVLVVAVGFFVGRAGAERGRARDDAANAAQNAWDIRKNYR
jgi:di/tricarboxylate transporter